MVKCVVSLVAAQAGQHEKAIEKVICTNIDLARLNAGAGLC